jgi:hypothetical protein
LGISIVHFLSLSGIIFIFRLGSLFSSSAVLFMPIMIETERIGIEEMQKQQQRQILLGPGAAVSGGGPPIPGM